MLLKRTFVWKVMTIWISQELPLFNFEHLDILCARIGHHCENLWPFEFLESFRCSISSVCICDTPESDLGVKSYDHLNFSRASVVKFERVNILCARIGHPCEKWWPIEFLDSFRCLMSSVSIYFNPESDLSAKSDDHLNFSRASIVQFRACLYVMLLNRTSVWKIMTNWISRELPIFNFERLDIL